MPLLGERPHWNTIYLGTMQQIRRRHGCRGNSSLARRYRRRICHTAHRGVCVHGPLSSMEIAHEYDTSTEQAGKRRHARSAASRASNAGRLVFHVSRVEAVQATRTCSCTSTVLWRGLKCYLCPKAEDVMIRGEHVLQQRA